ncbi:MAG: prepilin-type N-terminal cleavage/methylation domain-containing protein [Candidatus Omnitrophica bacterium]|nr:prepilin-type N-terminal cleavage/methylation domain-containing protein [Candidatus Omnitrophota bacterium]
MKKTGFTLIELIVVIAIIAVLAAIIAPNAFKAVEKAKIAHLIGDFNAIRTATLNYYSEIGFWPPDVCPNDDPGFTSPTPHNVITGGAPGCLGPYGLPANWQAIANNNWDGPYLEKYPAANPWGGSYDFENWDTDLALPDPRGIYITVRGLSRGVIDHLKNMGDKFPFSISETVRWTDTITSKMVDLVNN